MVRTTEAAVIALLRNGGDYGLLPDGSAPSMTGYVETGSSMIDRLVVIATARGVTVSDTDLELWERWLGAWAYAMSDKTYASKGTGRGSASFQQQSGLGLEANNYGQTALRIDWTGILNSMDKKNRAGGGWLGKPRISQRSYAERNV